MPLVTTGLYAAPLTLIMIALSMHVTMLRAKTGISILDGGNLDLAERIRRHGNFIETAPMGLLLIAIAELSGGEAVFLNISGCLLVAGRLLHARGLNRNNGTAPARIAGGVATTMAAILMVITTLRHVLPNLSL